MKTSKLIDSAVDAICNRKFPGCPCQSLLIRDGKLIVLPRNHVRSGDFLVRPPTAYDCTAGLTPKEWSEINEKLLHLNSKGLIT